jgi:hypothetical protein
MLYVELIMSRICKKIPLFMLCLASMALIAHMVIPHDHHLSGSFSTEEDRCPESNNKTSHHPGIPVHCHAFNDLASEKAKTFQILHDFENEYIALHATPDDLIPHHKVSEVRFTDLPILLFTSPYCRLFLLRAPPLQA